MQGFKTGDEEVVAFGKSFVCIFFLTQERYERGRQYHTWYYPLTFYEY
jgi:hypothetical protein